MSGPDRAKDPMTCRSQSHLSAASDRVMAVAGINGRFNAGWNNRLVLPCLPTGTRLVAKALVRRHLGRESRKDLGRSSEAPASWESNRWLETRTSKFRAVLRARSQIWNRLSSRELSQKITGTFPASISSNAERVACCSHPSMKRIAVSAAYP